MKPIDNLKLNQTPFTAQNLKAEQAAPKKAVKKNASCAPKDRVSLKGKQTPAAPKKWTVLAYLTADCNLEEYMVQDLIDMEKVGSDKNMNLLVEIDRGDKDTATTKYYDGVKGAARYYVEKFQLKPGDLDGFTRYNPATMENLNGLHNKITSPELAQYGQVNGADYKRVQDFLKWGMKEYPAKNYLILAFGHGGGASGMLTDEGIGSNATVSLPQLRKAIQGAERANGVKKDNVVIALKSCQMGQTETAYELKDAGAYLLASQSTIYANTWPMNEIFDSELTGTPGLADKNPAEMARHLFDINADRKDAKEISTLSLIDLHKAGQVGGALTNFAKALKESTEDPIELKKFMEIKSRPLFLSNTENCHYNSDLYDAAMQIAYGLDLHSPEAKKLIDDNMAAIAKRNLEQALKKNPNPTKAEMQQLVLESAAPNEKEVADLDKKLKETFTAQASKDPNLRKAADQLVNALDKMVLDAHRNDRDFGYNKNALGISIHTNTDPERFEGLHYQDLAFDKKTGWAEAMTSYANGITMEEMNRNLDDSQVRYKGLKEVNQIAAKTLKEYGKLDEELAKYEKDISAIKDNPKKPPFAKYVDAFYKTYDMLTPITKMTWAIYNNEKDNKDKFGFSLFSELNSSIIKTVVGDPKLAKDVLKAGLAVFAGLQGGKVNTQNIGRAAHNLLKIKNEMDKELSPKDRKFFNAFLQESNRDKKVAMLDKMEHEKSPVHPKAEAMMNGLNMLYSLGYATNNHKFINVKNYSGFNQLAFLKNLSEIGRTTAAAPRP